MGIIKNYGRFWNREQVDWGTRGRTGTLRGYKKRSESVDFRGQAGVYILYEGDSIPTHRVTYIGQADDLFIRLRQHRTDHLWNRWQRFSWFGIYSVGKSGNLVHANAKKRVQADVGTLLNELEGVLSVTIEPLLNKRGPNWKGVEEYFQSTLEEIREEQPERE
jgi:uncharacterized protein (UPF0248 family)